MHESKRSVSVSTMVSEKKWRPNVGRHMSRRTTRWLYRPPSYASVLRATRAASTIATKAGRTSSQRRVFKPQSGFTQSCFADKTFVVYFKRSTISHVVGIHGTEYRKRQARFHSDIDTW